MKFMRKFDEILLKIWENYRRTIKSKVYKTWKNLLKIRDKLCNFLKIWDL